MTLLSTKISKLLSEALSVFTPEFKAELKPVYVRVAHTHNRLRR